MYHASVHSLVLMFTFTYSVHVQQKMRCLIISVLVLLKSIYPYVLFYYKAVHLFSIQHGKALTELLYMLEDHRMSLYPVIVMHLCCRPASKRLLLILSPVYTVDASTDETLFIPQVSCNT